MLKKIVYYTLIFGLFLFSPVLNIYGVQPDTESVYAKIDATMAEESAEELDTLLSSLKSTSLYPLYESYTMKKIRNLVIKKKYDLAKDDILAVINNNLENNEAVNLYSVIDDALTEEKKRLAEDERQRQLLAARKEAEEQKARKEVRQEYQEIKTVSGTSVYVDPNEQTYSSLGWNFVFGMADLSAATIPDKNYNSVRYGLSVDAGIQYLSGNVLLACDVAGEFSLFTVAGTDFSALSSVTVVPSIAFPSFNKNLFLRFGGGAFITTRAPDMQVLTGTFLTPVTGIGIRNIVLGSSRFSAYYDYYAGHIFYDDIQTAMSGGLSLGLTMGKIENVHLEFNIGIRDTVFVKTEGIENRPRLVLSVGVDNVIE